MITAKLRLNARKSPRPVIAPRRPRARRWSSGDWLGSRYQLIAPHARGGRTWVWRGWDHGRARGTNKWVALKLLAPGTIVDPELRASLAEEARVGRRMQHRHLVPVLDSVLDTEGLPGLVLEWVDGVDLRRVLDHAPTGIPWDEAAAMVAMTLRGLAAAHGSEVDGKPCPIVHRDVSPENILLTSDGRVRVTDFGIARAADRRGLSTGTGVIKGKLPYLPAERLAGEPASILADLYAAAVVLYELIAGELPYDDANELACCRAIAAGDATPLAERADVPRVLSSLVRRAMHSQPEDRPQSGLVLAHSLESIVAHQGRPDVHRRLRARAHHLLGDPLM